MGEQTTISTKAIGELIFLLGFPGGGGGGWALKLCVAHLQEDTCTSFPSGSIKCCFSWHEWKLREEVVGLNFLPTLTHSVEATRLSLAPSRIAPLTLVPLIDFPSHVYLKLLGFSFYLSLLKCLQEMSWYLADFSYFRSNPKHPFWNLVS